MPIVASSSTPPIRRDKEASPPDVIVTRITRSSKSANINPNWVKEGGLQMSRPVPDYQRALYCFEQAAEVDPSPKILNLIAQLEAKIDRLRKEGLVALPKCKTPKRNAKLGRTLAKAKTPVRTKGLLDSISL